MKNGRLIVHEAVRTHMIFSTRLKSEDYLCIPPRIQIMP